MRWWEDPPNKWTAVYRIVVLVFVTLHLLIGVRNARLILETRERVERVASELPSFP